MRKIIILLLGVLVLESNAQITITDVDIPTDPVKFDLNKAQLDSFIIPVEGSDKLWNYSNLKKEDVSSLEFKEANNSAFPLSALVQENIFDEVTQGMGFFYDEYYIENSDFFGVSGLHVNGVGFDLSSITFSTGDSLIFQDIDYKYDDPVVLIDYPLTNSSNWNVNNMEEGDFELTVKFYGLDHSKGKRIRRKSMDFEVVGWGKIVLPYDTTYSKEYEVLMLKTQLLQIDSFFLDGAPASPLLMAAFGLTQGDQKIENNYLFLSKGKIQPLMNVGFGSNNFKNVLFVYYDPDVEVTSIQENTLKDLSIYPSITDYLINIENAENSKMKIFNIQGRLVTDLNINSIHETINISYLDNGSYIIQIMKNNFVRNFKILKK